MNLFGLFYYISCGSIFFPLSFLITRAVIKKIGFGNEEATLNDVTVKLVSTLQAILACATGTCIVWTCKDDVMYSRNELTNTYTAFGFPYMIYDVFVMYRTHTLDHPQVAALRLGKRIQHYFCKKKLIILHHLVLPIIYVPIILYFRNGKGDFIIGCFFLMEMAVPWISFRNIMLRLGKENSSLFLINGYVMVFFFTVSRVLIFPFIYYMYSNSNRIEFLQAFGTIPIKCHVGCSILFILQSYWWILMVRGLWKLTRKKFNGSEKSF